MSEIERIELFVLKCAVISRELDKELSRTDPSRSSQGPDIDRDMQVQIRQFDIENRINAERMSNYYRIFYMLENDIRTLISDTLEDAHGPQWWQKSVPQNVKDEVEKNRKREEDAGITARSDKDIDYITFGHLGEIIRANWADFGGILSNQSALNRVLFQLNMSRGAIAHCGILAEDEIERLKLTIKDWFRVLAGPSKK